MFKRIFLFIAVNLLVVLTISLTLNLLGVRPYLDAQGIDYSALLVMCTVVGFVGAFISLALSRIMAKMLYGVQIIDPNSATSVERDLVNTIHQLARKAGLPAMPEVGIYASPEVNAFATGPTRSRSLVAVSSGLLESMDKQAVEGVLGHEISHIANGDMVTMTLLQGVVNTFVMFFARVAAWAVSNAMQGSDDRRDRGASPWVFYLTTMAFEILFSLLGSFVVAYYSRRREFRADAGSAKVGGREKMIHALRSLQAHHEQIDTRQAAVAALKINGGKGFFALLSTHPPLEDRIAALQRA